MRPIKRLPIRVERTFNLPSFVWMIAATPTLLQKVMHVMLYTLLAFLWAWTLGLARSMPVRLLSAFVVTVTFGAALEWSQTFIPRRFGTLVDVVLNAAGALVGILVAMLLL